MASEIQTSTVEGKLEGAGTFFIIISIVALIACVFISQNDIVKQTGLGSF